MTPTILVSPHGGRARNILSLGVVCAFFLGAGFVTAQQPQPLPATEVGAPRPTTTTEPPPVVAPPPEIPPPPPPPAININESRSAPVVNNLGSPPAASEGSINQLDLADQPILRPGDVLENIPGLIAEDHTGTVKANEYFLRGFFLDHGTDFSIRIDDVPYNEPNHPHLHGYLDINSMIPELVSTIDFKKGVYYPEAGDFSSAGTADITMVDSLDHGILKSEIGKDSYYRELVADSSPLGQGTLLYAASAEYFNGPWEFPENSRLFNGILRYTLGDADNGMRVTGQMYSAVGRITDNIPQLAVESGLLNRFGTFDPFEGLSTRRDQVNAQWWHTNDDGDVTKANVYYVNYRFSIYTNPDGDLMDPVNGDLVQQHEQRSTLGGNVSHTWSDLSDRVKNTVGLQVRYDDIPVIGDNHVVARNLLNVLDLASIEESNVGVYYVNEVKWTDKVRTVLGVRGDYFYWNVDDEALPVNSGKTDAKVFEPKGSLILGPWEKTEFYLDGGFGFHTNDARGLFATEALPFVPFSEGGTLTTGGTPSNPIARTRGAEVGMKTDAIPGLTATAALWYLHLESEVVFDPVGLLGAEPRGPSQRYGVELSTTYRLRPWLTFDADFADSRAIFLGAGADPDSGLPDVHVDQAVGIVVTAGPTLRFPNGCFTALRYRYLGPRYLVPDGTISSSPTNVFDLSMGYDRQRFTVGVDVLNLFNSNDHEIDFANPSQIGSVAIPNSITFHPLQPLQARFYMTLKF